MRVKSEYPTRHADQHLAGGSDPLPGWANPPGSGGIDYSDYVASLSNLIGYWRLGETGSPWADTSGYAGGPRPMIIHNSSGTPATPLTPDVTGALPSAQDDGAVQFNYNGSSFSSTGQYLNAPVAGGDPSGFWTLNHMTASAFVNFSAAASGRNGYILTNQTYTTSDQGWGLLVEHTSHKVLFTRGVISGTEYYARTPAALNTDQWYHVVGTYDGANVKLYIDGVLSATTADTSNTAVGITGPVYCGYYVGNNTHQWLTGTVDEAAVWNRALTADEIAGLADAGADHTGDNAGKALLANGDGGTYWDFPLEVTY